MSSQTDKVIFVSSLALAIAGGAFFLIGADAPVVKDIAITRAAPDPVTIEEPINPLSVWAYPAAQRALPQDPKLNKKPEVFILELFTPPKLYFKAPFWSLKSDTPPPKPFPFVLTGVYQKPFRIQFGSYSKIGDEITVYLKDLDLRKEFEVKQGDKLPDQGIEVRSVALEDVSEGGAISKIASVEIYDVRSKRTYRLVEKQPEVMEPTFYAKVRDITSKPPKETEVVQGAKLTADGVTYNLVTLDGSSKTVSFTFKEKDDIKDNHEVLTIQPGK